VIWEAEITKVNDMQLSTKAIAELYANFAQERIPNPTDFRDMVRKIRKDDAPTVIAETGFVRDMPAWVKGWAIARYAHNDMRVWPEQKPGYDDIQQANPHTRTHVWPDQELMPAEERTKYEERGKHLTAAKVAAMLGGGAP
jgi:hypothetical protein